MFASEKRAVGECDRCAMTFPLKELRFLTIRMKRTNLRVCPDCFESDHPQYKLGTFKVFDPQALKNPRPADNTDRALIQAGTIGDSGGAGTASVPLISNPFALGGSTINTNLIG